ncbi:helix-turn-helix domain-containing protein [Comamonas badia]|uniref:helix-turn-helix domain-containing protein n=1 Tax=Comamonas badia TaxID=265291 RepID=UPI000466F1D3|nr:helix-turn-helix domain-containing protein [Comamonas badia]
MSVNSLGATAHAPHQLFAPTHAERVQRARIDFFEQGLRPSGLVSEAVIQSWMRCLRVSSNQRQKVAFEPVSASRQHAARERSRGLLELAQPPLQTLEQALSGTGAHVLLTNGDGVMLYATPAPQGRRMLMHGVARTGVCVAEAQVGTNAPGVVVATGKACTVTASEHYFEGLHGLRCAAAPIRNTQGALVGVLDVSVENQTFGFDPAAMVGLYATTIENALLRAQARDQLVLRFQTHPSLLDSPLEGLAGVAADGTLAWTNEAGARLLGCAAPGPQQMSALELLATDMRGLLGLAHADAARPLRLASGLGLWVQVRLREGVPQLQAWELPAAQPPAAAVQPVAREQEQEPQPAATLRAHSRQLIQQTLAEQGGNVQRTARLLGISRGTLYRRLREPQSPADSSSAV